MEVAKNLLDKSPVVTKPQTGQGGMALIEVESQRAMAEVQGALIIAQRFPRNQIQALDRIKTACQRKGLAEKALYSYSKGGTDIGGPSIRLAETAAQNWGNMQYGIRELDQRPGESTVEAFAWDMETNVRSVKQFTVKHKRYTKSGSYDLVDPREIYEMTANQGARRLRACILAVIPGDVIDEAVTQCEDTLKTKVDTSAAALKKMLEAFEAFKVTREMIEKRIQRRIDAITPAQFIQLKKIYNSLNDNMSTPADWFEVVAVKTPAAPATDQNANLKNKLKNKRGISESAPAPTPAENAGSDTTAAPAESKTEEYAPTFCPDDPETTFKKEHCDACPKRKDSYGKDCPAWA